MDGCHAQRIRNQRKAGSLRAETDKNWQERKQHSAHLVGPLRHRSAHAAFRPLQPIPVSNGTTSHSSLPVASRASCPQHSARKPLGWHRRSCWWPISISDNHRLRHLGVRTPGAAYHPCHTSAHAGHRDRHRLSRAGAIAGRWRRRLAIAPTCGGVEPGGRHALRYRLLHGFCATDLLGRAWQEPELRILITRAAILPHLGSRRAIIHALDIGAARSLRGVGRNHWALERDNAAAALLLQANPTHIWKLAAAGERLRAP